MSGNEVKKKAGRKPGKDNKIPITLYVERSVLTELGSGELMDGKEGAREAALNAVYAAYAMKKVLPKPPTND